jgi:hypothetical protein
MSGDAIDGSHQDADKKNTARRKARKIEFSGTEQQEFAILVSAKNDDEAVGQKLTCFAVSSHYRPRKVLDTVLAPECVHLTEDFLH